MQPLATTSIYVFQYKICLITLIFSLSLFYLSVQSVLLCLRQMCQPFTAQETNNQQSSPDKTENRKLRGHRGMETDLCLGQYANPLPAYLTLPYALMQQV